MRKELQTTISSYNKSALDYDTIAKLDNYNKTYDYYCKSINATGSILDLACGPANISSYIKNHLPAIQVTGVDLSQKMIEIAKQKIPSGNFFIDDIIHFKSDKPFDAIILGFAIPYLNKGEIEELFKNINQNLIHNGKLYLSFMAGCKEGFEVPSFNNTVELYIYYYEKTIIKSILDQNKFVIEKEWELDYHETDGSITKDIVIVAEKNLKM
jgi:ubiquinone/menaquinone biosynthesis C-methylase UbiE